MNLGFFTRLPTFAGGMLSAQGRDPNPDVQRHLFACSFWATPISALIIGGIMAALWWLAMTIWHNPLLAAGLALAAHALLTGALHDDGLADLADAMGGADPLSGKLFGCFIVSVLMMMMVMMMTSQRLGLFGHFQQS